MRSAKTAVIRGSREAKRRESGGLPAPGSRATQGPGRPRPPAADRRRAAAGRGEDGVPVPFGVDAQSRFVHPPILAKWNRRTTCGVILGRESGSPFHLFVKVIVMRAVALDSVPAAPAVAEVDTPRPEAG